MKNLKLQCGQSLFEVVVAVAISALIVTAIVALASNSIQNSSYSRDKTIASTYVQETLEWLKQEKSQNLTEFRTHAINNTGSDITYCLESLSWPANQGKCSSSETVGNKFIREVVFPICTGICSENLVEIDVNVSWEDAKGIHIISSTTEISTI